ncbi:MAG: rhomboid family intramembrane serine protease [Bacilli bacterium]
MEDINKKDELTMTLLHYFITEADYIPVIIKGLENEIWLENLNNDYKIVRIVSNYIHNEEQLDFDMFRANALVKKIKKTTFSLQMNILSIFTDMSDELTLSEIDNCIKVKDVKDFKSFKHITEIFPGIDKKLKHREKGLQLFVKITNDIANKNQESTKQLDEVFTLKKPIVTWILIAINIVIFLAMMFDKDEIIFNLFANYGPYVRNGQLYRLFTSGFLHANILHLGFNMYALNIIGSQLESYIGKTKYLIVYFFSIIMGSLFSIAFINVPSLGASGGIFGLLGALLYFGYHYRVFLGNVLKSQIIPLIVLNLILGFVLTGVDNSAHIGGLVGGFLITAALGIKYKSNKSNKINGLIMTIMLTVFMIILNFFL